MALIAVHARLFGPLRGWAREALSNRRFVEKLDCDIFRVAESIRAYTGPVTFRFVFQSYLKTRAKWYR